MSPPRASGSSARDRTGFPLPSRPLTEARRAVLHRRIRWVVAATITYNVVEAVVALAAGAVASSSALIGFGLDSIVEVLSAAAVAWQFSGPDPIHREKPALRLIAVSFFGLAAFVTVDAGRSLLGGADPEHSPVGIVLAAVSLAVMPTLSWFERRTGRELGSASAVADSRQTLTTSATTRAATATARVARTDARALSPAPPSPGPARRRAATGR